MSRNSDGRRKVPAMGNTSQDTVWTIGNLPNGTYYWSVQAIDNTFGGSPFANEQIFALNPQPPASPEFISAFAGNEAAVLKWNAVKENDIVRYRIYRETSPGAAIQVDSTADTSRVISNLSNGVTYYFRIAAVDNVLLYSPYSNELSVMPTSGSPDITAPAVPLNLSLTTGDGQVALTWRQNKEIDFLRYRIYQSTAPDAVVQADSSITNISDTTAIITGLTNGTAYYFRVAAVDTAWNVSLFSNEVSTTPFVLPSMPGSLSATTMSTSQINLTWSAGANTNKYRIYRSLTSGSGFSQIDSVNSPTTSYNNTGLSAGTTYFYFVVGVNAFGVSVNSNETNSFTNSVSASFGLTNVSSFTPAPGSSVTITSQVSGTNPVVKMFFGKPGQATGDSVTMIPSGNNYSGIIPGSAVTQEGTWFRLRGQNAAGVVYYPSSGAQALSVQITDMSSITAQSNFPNGLSSGAYFTVGVSFNGTLNLTNYFGPQEEAGGGPANWRALTFNTSTQSFSDVTSVSGGNAYFMYHRTGQYENIFNSFSGTTVISSDMFNNWILKPGWNLVAWPYAFAANISSRDPSKVGSVWWMNGKSGWEAATQLKPFGGYMIRNKTLGDITLGSALVWTRAVAKLQSELSPMSIRFIAESGEYRDAFNFAGTDESATEAYDTSDELDPFVMDAGVNAYFVNTSSAGSRKLSYDIRSTSSAGHVWDLVVENTTGQKETHLKWETINSNEIQRAVLLDITHNKKVETATLNNYVFANSVTTKFKVFVGEQSWVDDQVSKIEASLPKEFSLSQNYPNPFNPTTTIKFDVAQSGNVRIKVYNVLGQEVATLVNGYYETGRAYSAKWNGKDQLGREVASGVYIYRLESGRVSKTKKMLFIK
jgi:fibronectin type 3 domain-containing protein